MLETTCIKQSTALRDHCSDNTPLLLGWSLNISYTVVLFTSIDEQAGQSPKNPLVCSYLGVQNGQGRVIFLTRLSSRTSDNQKSDYKKYSICLHSESSKLQIFTRPQQILPDQKCDNVTQQHVINFILQDGYRPISLYKKSDHSDSSGICMYPSLHNRYIACVYPKYCNNKGGDFPRRTFGFKTGKLFCLLFTVCNFLFSVLLNFVGQSVLYSSAYLFDRHKNYLM